MKNGKFENKAVPAHKSASVRSLALLLALVLLLGGVIGGTIAWLTAKTTEVTNTFTTSDISIELKEHKYDPGLDKLTGEETTTGVNNYKMIPGWTIPKDPWAMVTTNSEDCYLFVKVTKSSNFDTYMTSAIADGWTELQNPQGVDAYSKVYYKIFDSKSTDANKPVKGEKYPILADNKVTVNTNVTKEMMAEITNDEQKPTLTFTAYAVQLYKNNATPFTPADAWANAPKG